MVLNMTNEQLNKITSQPIFFERNRVARVYTGGKLFGDFFGDDGTDGYLPEEWIASAVRAINKGGTNPKEGISKIRGTDVYFDDLLVSHKTELIGQRESLDVLIKMLDSAERLPVQAHPDKAFSRKHFNSNFGKAESWTVVGVREGAKIYHGFSRKVSPEEFEAAIQMSLDKADGFSPFLNEVEVAPGDCFYIPANTIHAIGPGCLILEVMEPTDFTISPEYWCGDYRLSDEEMYLGLDKDTAISVFNFDSYGGEALEANRLWPAITEQNGNTTRENIVGPHITDCFSLNRITIKGVIAMLKAAPAIYVVTDGKGMLQGENYSKSLKKGDYFFLPVKANKRFSIVADDMEIYECQPPAAKTT